jgi:glutamate-1-semialdehyde 2,1-aminomutase
MQDNLQKLGMHYTINRVGSMFSIFFTEQPVTDFESAKTSDTALFGRYFNGMLQRGIYLAPSQYESLFVSTAITDELVQEYLQSNLKALQEAIR